MAAEMVRSFRFILGLLFWGGLVLTAAARQAFACSLIIGKCGGNAKWGGRLRGGLAEQASYRIDSVPIQFFASWRLGKQVGEGICYRIDYFFPEVFARSDPVGCPVKQRCYRMDSVPLLFFAAGRLG